MKSIQHLTVAVSLAVFCTSTFAHANTQDPAEIVQLNA